MRVHKTTSSRVSRRVDLSLQDHFIAVAVNGAAALGRPAVQGLAFGVERRKHAAEVGEEPRVSVQHHVSL
jgi:hypothetical protein